MVNKELDEEMFDLVLKQAFKEELQLEMKDFPSTGELDRLYTPSPRAEKRLKTLARRRISPFPVVKYLKRAAVVMLCICSAAFGLSMLSPSVQADMKRAMMQEFTTHIDVTFLPEDANPPPPQTWVQRWDDTYMQDYQIGYLPEGFELHSQIVQRRMGDYEWRNAEGKFISFEVAPATCVFMSIDNEGHKLESITIHGCEGYFNCPTEWNRYPLIFWLDGEYLITVEGSVSSSELFKVAESITQKKE